MVRYFVQVGEELSYVRIIDRETDQAVCEIFRGGDPHLICAALNRTDDPKLIERFNYLRGTVNLIEETVVMGGTIQDILVTLRTRHESLCTRQCR